MRYLYYPILVELTEAESRAYHRLTTRIGWVLTRDKDWENNENITALLIQKISVNCLRQ